MKFLLALLATMSLSYSAFSQSVVVDIVLNPMGDFKAKTSEVKGEAVLKGDEVSAQNIVVDLKSLKTGVTVRDTHTLKYLDVTKYPEAILISATGKGGNGTGKIKIRGQVRDITGTYTIKGKFLEAKFKLKLSKFGIVDINYMGAGVEDEVTLNVTVPLKS